MDKVNVLSNSNEFVSPTPPKWDDEEVTLAPPAFLNDSNLPIASHLEVPAFLQNAPQGPAEKTENKKWLEQIACASKKGDMAELFYLTHVTPVIAAKNSLFSGVKTIKDLFKSKVEAVPSNNGVVLSSKEEDDFVILSAEKSSTKYK